MNTPDPPPSVRGNKASRLRFLLLIVLPVLVTVLWGIREEIMQYRQAQAIIVNDATSAASSYAGRIGNRVNAQFTQLQFIAQALLGPEIDPAVPPLDAVKAMRQFMVLHPDLYALNIQSSDGNRIEWSTRKQSDKPILQGELYTPLASQSDFLLGQDKYAARVGAHVIPMRVRVRDGTGQTLYFVGTPYRLNLLLADTTKDLPWTFVLRDMREGSLLGVWRRGRVDFTSHSLVRGDVVRAAIPDYPLEVIASWPSDLVRETYWQNAKERWPLELGTLALLVVGAWEIMRLSHQRDQSLLQQQRLAAFNALLAQVNLIIADAGGEADLLQSICNVSVKYGELRLAFVASPDPQGRFHLLAVSGDADYAKGIVLSTDPEVPEGQGPEGRAWREGKSQFYPSFSRSAHSSAWYEHAERHGIRSAATLLILRGLSQWGILSIYRAREGFADTEFKSVFEEIALGISRGLDRLDSLNRERRQSALQNTLLNNAMVGIALATDRHILQANQRFADMLGYAEPQDLVGQSSAMVYALQKDYERVGALYPTLQAQGHVFLPDVVVRRRDGSSIVCDLAGKIVEDPVSRDRSTSVWSFLDITERHALQDRLEYLATHDALTGLSNRRALDASLPLALARARRSGTVLAVGVIDLDDFKPINDTFGHEAGDTLLQSLAKRLQAQLRKTDLLARQGGDEFVVIIEELEELHTIQQLQIILTRLHQAVETPFEVAPGQMAEVGMSMGLALFPMDGTEDGPLLRLADAALHQAKTHKNTRTQWWWLGASSSEQSERESVFDPYGLEAAELLDKAQSYFSTLIMQFVDQFYGELAQGPVSRAILASLSAEEMQSLKVRQAEQLRFLLAPQTSRSMIIERARHLGQVHALVGLSSSLLVQSLSLYRGLLSAHLNVAPLAARSRYRLLRAAESRLQDDIEAELQAAEATSAVYMTMLSRPLPKQGAPWADIVSAEFQQIGRLPGVAACELLRRDQSGVLQCDASGGPHAEELQAVLHTPGPQSALLRVQSGGKDLVAAAWLDDQIVSAASFRQDPRTQVWHAALGNLQIRSMLVVPVSDASGHVCLALAIQGAYPNQFESPWMQQFAQSLRRRWEESWRRCCS